MLSAYHCVMSTISLVFVSSAILLLRQHHSVVSAFQQSRPVLLPTLVTSASNRLDSASLLATSSAAGVSRNLSAMNMVRNRGLERLVEGATPLPGGMALYIKPGPDGKSVGDCPFAHFVRMVLAEKNLEYDLIPCTPDNKPNWLIEEYSGKMPALRHRKECYVDSEVIAQYLDFFFVEPELSPGKGKGGEEMAKATEAAEGFFPAMAKYIKYRSNGDEEDVVRRSVLEERLQALEDHLSDASRKMSSEEGGPYIVGDGKQFTLLDCSLAPKLYALDVCLTEVKGWSTDELKTKYPHVQKYMDALFERPSFQTTVEYGKETVVWGWTSDH